jgi:hypothetical protein
LQMVPSTVEGAAQPPREGWFRKVRKLAKPALEWAYRVSFGQVPDVNKYHPLWNDTHYVIAKIAHWRAQGARVLWLSSQDSLFHRHIRTRVDPGAIIGAEFADSTMSYDACLCELTLDELADLRDYYGRLRQQLRNGGEIVVYVLNKFERQIASNDVAFCERALPDVDLSEIRMFGSKASSLWRRWYFAVCNSWQNRPVVRGLLTGAVLLTFAPFVRLTNALAARRDPAIVPRAWTSLVIACIVKKVD